MRWFFYNIKFREYLYSVRKIFSLCLDIKSDTVILRKLEKISFLLFHILYFENDMKLEEI